MLSLLPTLYVMPGDMGGQHYVTGCFKSPRMAIVGLHCLLIQMTAHSMNQGKTNCVKALFCDPWALSPHFHKKKKKKKNLKFLYQ